MVSVAQLRGMTQSWSQIWTELVSSCVRIAKKLSTHKTAGLVVVLGVIRVAIQKMSDQGVLDVWNTMLGAFVVILVAQNGQLRLERALKSRKRADDVATTVDDYVPDEIDSYMSPTVESQLIDPFDLDDDIVVESIKPANNSSVAPSPTTSRLNKDQNWQWYEVLTVFGETSFDKHTRRKVRSPNEPSNLDLDWLGEYVYDQVNCEKHAWNYTQVVYDNGEGDLVMLRFDYAPVHRESYHNHVRLSSTTQDPDLIKALIPTCFELNENGTYTVVPTPY